MIEREMGNWKFLKKLLLTFPEVIFLLAIESVAQETGSPAINEGRVNRADTAITSAIASEWLPTTAVYLELGGKVLYSLNVDFRKKEDFAFSAGASYYKEDGDTDTAVDSQSMLFASVMGYYLTGKQHRLELGGGICPGFGSSEGLAAMAIYGSVGYRYQRKKGLIFRVAFTPFVGIPVGKDDHISVIPWAAISLGYSF